MSRPALQDNRTPAATADYVAAMSADLAVLARRSGLDTLGYLLDMARLEAENVLRNAGGEP
jgi:hypothetical protein